MSLQSEIDKWVKSAAGKKKFESANKEALASGRTFGSPGVEAAKEPNYYAQRLTEILDSEIGKAGFAFGDYLYWVDQGYNEAEKRYELHVNFKPEEIDRPSLAPETYREGAYDIVALMNHGYRAAGVVHGEWRGKETWSRRAREGAFFIQKAIETFNEQYRSVAQATYSDKY